MQFPYMMCVTFFVLAILRVLSLSLNDAIEDSFFQNDVVFEI